jgi:hypothetical protein
MFQRDKMFSTSGVDGDRDSLSCPAFFGLNEFGLCVWFMLSCLNACVIIAMDSVTLSEICRTFDAVPLSDPPRYHIRPDARLPLKACKESARPPSCVKLCTLIPKISEYYCLQLHRATTPAVQMTASVSEIKDTSSYK